MAQLFSLGHLTVMDYRKIITIDPRVENGKPCIRGLPITVIEIISRLADGMTIEQVLAVRTQLAREDIKACLEFSADQARGR